MGNDVRVTGLGGLKKQLGEDTDVASGQSIRQAVELLNLRSSQGLPFTPVVNGRVVAWDYVLKPGDELVLVPTIGGGFCITSDRRYR